MHDTPFPLGIMHDTPSKLQLIKTLSCHKDIDSKTGIYMVRVQDPLVNNESVGER